MKEQLTWNITGEFVTETARSWLYEEFKPYKDVMDFLLGCLINPEISDQERKQYAKDILLGKKKMIGSTADNTYTLADDDCNIKKEYDFYFNELSLTENFNEDEYKDRPKEMRPIRKYKDGDYGWLSPEGKFFQSDWGNHQEESYKLVRKFYGEDALYSDKGDNALYKRGWSLLHNPMNYGITQIEEPKRGLSKKQKEFLYDYYMNSNNILAANDFFAD